MRTPRMRCPRCGNPVSPGGSWKDGIRLFQHFICDTPRCRVSSFRVEWREEGE